MCLCDCYIVLRKQKLAQTILVPRKHVITPLEISSTTSVIKLSILWDDALKTYVVPSLSGTICNCF